MFCLFDELCDVLVKVQVLGGIFLEKVENLPKALDYQPQTYKLNQIVSSEIVRAFLEPPQQQMKMSLSSPSPPPMMDDA